MDSISPNPPPHEQVPAPLLDALLAIAVALVLAIVISADQGGQLNPDLYAYLFAVGCGALLLFRRQHPLLVLGATLTLIFAYYRLGYPSIGTALPIVAALFSATDRGHMAAATVASLTLLSVSTFFRLRGGETVAYLLGYETIYTVALLAAAIALGDSVRSRRALRHEQSERLRLVAQEERYLAEQRTQAERLQVARDLHDTLGHTLALISLQAHVASEALGAQHTEGRQALEHIHTASAASMSHLRATVKQLRTPTSTDAPWSRPSLANLDQLLEGARSGGLHTEVAIQGDLAVLPAPVATAAYRIIQESLTNVLRHARASRVSVRLRVASTHLELAIEDDGRPQGDLTPGNGMAGMQERARLLGGRLTVMPTASSGVEVRATLPLGEEG